MGWDNRLKELETRYKAHMAWHDEQRRAEEAVRTVSCHVCDKELSKTGGFLDAGGRHICLECLTAAMKKGTI